MARSRKGKSRNPNHPKKGSHIKAEPIRRLEDIARMKAFLAPCPRDACIFTLGINTAMRSCELVSLKIGQVIHLKVGDELSIKQSKNKKYRPITINQNAYDAIQACLASHPDRDNMFAPLIYSKTSKHCLRSNTLSKYMKDWCEEIGMTGNYSSHTMRKTWGFHIYRKGLVVDDNYHRPPKIAELMIAYGHATERQTLTYLCIQDTDISSLFVENIL